MTKQEEIQKAINPLLEIIYELYLKDLKSGKLNINQYMEPVRAVGNPIIKK